METNINTPNMFLVLPLEVASDENISATSKLLFGYILGLTHNKEGKCYASDEYLSNSLHVSRASIQRLLKELEDATYISREVVYKENSKEVDFRYISVNIRVGSLKNKNTGILKNKRDNNKDLNNKDPLLHKGVSENPLIDNNSLNNNSLAKKISSLDDLENMTFEDIELNFSKSQNQKVLLAYINKSISSKKIIEELTEWLQLSYLHKRPFYLSGLINQLKLLNGFSEEEIISIIKNCTLADKSTFKYEIEKREREKKYQNNINSTKPRVTEQKRTTQLGSITF